MLYTYFELCRTPEKQWMAIGMIPTCDSLLAEGANMSALGPQHADKTHWVELDIPFADFLLNARMVLTRYTFFADRVFRVDTLDHEVSEIGCGFLVWNVGVQHTSW